MRLDHYLFRAKRYYQKRGLIKTLRHTIFVGLRNCFQKEFILFTAELPQLEGREIVVPQGAVIVCREKECEISEPEYEVLLANGGKSIVAKQIKERFGKGAQIWLLKQESYLVGFVWSIGEKPVKPYFFPLTASDVHLFDNEIFSDYKGKGNNPFLIDYVLGELRKKGFLRAYIETQTWNKAEIKSLAKTAFQQLAVARKFSFFGKKIAVWSEKVG
jgi:hypothetical protein